VTWDDGSPANRGRSALGRRILAGIVLALVAAIIIAVFAFTGGHRNFIGANCELPATVEMLVALHTVSPTHSVTVTSNTEVPFQQHKFFLTESGTTVFVFDETVGKGICEFPAGS
jgi:hypothetical protein